MTRNFLTLLVFVGLIGSSSVLLAQEKYTIQPRFEPGKFVQTLATDNDMVMRVGDLESEDGIPMKQEQKIKYLVEASQPDAQGTQKVKMTFAEIKMTQNMMGVEMIYDSTDEDLQDPNLAPMFNAMLGAEFTFDLTKDGKSENVKGFDEMWEKMFKNMPGPAAEMIQSMKGNMGDEMLSNMLGGLENNFGKEPRAVGDKWSETRSMTVPFLGKTETESTHTLQSVKDDVAVIATEGKIKMQGDMIAMGPVKMKFEKGDMTLATTTSISIKTGLAFETKGETEMDLTTEMDVPANNAQKIQMRITSKAVSTVTIEKVE